MVIESDNDSSAELGGRCNELEGCSASDQRIGGYLWRTRPFGLGRGATVWIQLVETRAHIPDSYWPIAASARPLPVTAACLGPRHRSAQPPGRRGSPAVAFGGVPAVAVPGAEHVGPGELHGTSQAFPPNLTPYSFPQIFPSLLLKPQAQPNPPFSLLVLCLVPTTALPPYLEITSTVLVSRLHNVYLLAGECAGGRSRQGKLSTSTRPHYSSVIFYVRAYPVTLSPC